MNINWIVASTLAATTQNIFWAMYVSDLTWPGNVTWYYPYPEFWGKLQTCYGSRYAQYTGAAYPGVNMLRHCGKHKVQSIQRPSASGSTPGGTEGLLGCIPTRKQARLRNHRAAAGNVSLLTVSECGVCVCRWRCFYDLLTPWCKKEKYNIRSLRLIVFWIISYNSVTKITELYVYYMSFN